MKILDPVAPPPAAFQFSAAKLPGLQRRTVAVLTNRWMCMDVISKRLSERLTGDYGATLVMVEAVPLNGGAPDEVLERVIARADLAVVGLAN